MLSSYQSSRPAWQSLASLPPESVRHQLVSVLLSMSAILLHLAVRLQQAQTAAVAAAPAVAPRKAAPQLEYHAESGAPEGALYVDGELAGWITGVSRL